MSVAEITEELKQMTNSQRKEIARVLLELGNREEQTSQAANFAEAKSYVFDNYRELLRRLAE